MQKIQFEDLKDHFEYYGHSEEIAEEWAAKTLSGTLKVRGNLKHYKEIIEAYKKINYEIPEEDF